MLKREKPLDLVLITREVKRIPSVNALLTRMSSTAALSKPMTGGKETKEQRALRKKSVVSPPVEKVLGEAEPQILALNPAPVRGAGSLALPCRREEEQRDSRPAYCAPALYLNRLVL